MDDKERIELKTLIRDMVDLRHEITLEQSLLYRKRQNGEWVPSDRDREVDNRVSRLERMKSRVYSMVDDMSDRLSDCIGGE